VAGTGRRAGGAGLAEAGRPVDAAPDTAAAPPQARSTGQRVVDWLDVHALFVALVSVAIVLCLAGAGAHLIQDGYLGLVDGRLIALHGIPHHSDLTVMAQGVRWVDQQWLAQLAFYGLQHAGGYALLVLVDVALVALGLALAIFAARDLGASERQVIRVLPFGALFYVIIAVSIRTQVFAYPLFVITLWLLATSVRRPSRRVVFVFPILILWANLHGSATLGAGIAVLYGLTTLIAAARTRAVTRPVIARGAAFVVLPPLCLLATPYGTSIVHYYRSTLGNSEFGKLVTEWQPVTSEPILAVLFFALLAFVAWILVRSGRRTPLFDWLVLIALAAAAIFAIRNIIWFGLATVVLVPAALSQLGRYAEPMPRRRTLNLAISFTMLAITAIAVIANFAHPTSWFQTTYDNRGLTAIADVMARDPSAKIFPDVHYGDWLLWQHPAWAGRVAYDTSFELLPAHDLEAFTAFYHGRLGRYAGTLAPYTILVLDPDNKKETRLLAALPHVRVAYRSKKLIVATQPAT
jgi:hypothetical protein